MHLRIILFPSLGKGLWMIGLAICTFGIQRPMLLSMRDPLALYLPSFLQLLLPPPFSLNKLLPEQMVPMVLSRMMISTLEALTVARGLVSLAGVEPPIQMVLLMESEVLHMVPLQEVILLHQLQKMNFPRRPIAVVMKLLSVEAKYHHL